MSAKDYLEKDYYSILGVGKDVDDATLTSTDKNVSPVVCDDGLSLFNIIYHINDMGIDGNIITVANTGAGYNANTMSINISAPDVAGGTQAILGANVANGIIHSVYVTNPGSGYTDPPIVSVKSLHGNGAIISVALSEYNTSSQVIGRVVKTGVGRARGFWTTTRSFLNSDKYIQDSNYYQDYSYEIKVAETLDKYKAILYNTFHTAGSELFGKYLSINSGQSSVSVLSEPTSATIS